MHVDEARQRGGARVKFVPGKRLGKEAKTKSEQHGKQGSSAVNHFCWWQRWQQRVYWAALLFRTIDTLTFFEFFSEAQCALCAHQGGREGQGRDSASLRGERRVVVFFRRELCSFDACNAYLQDGKRRVPRPQRDHLIYLLRADATKAGLQPLQQLAGRKGLVEPLF